MRLGLSRAIIVINLEASPKRRGRPREFDCDTALLKAAETFWRLGYEGASIVDLTEAMGITPQSLYGAFGSKAELYKASLSKYQETAGAFARQALAEEPTAAAGVCRMLREAAHAFCRPGSLPGCMVSTGAIACAEENADITAYVAQLRADKLAMIEGRLARGLAEGDLAPETDVAGLARYVQAMLLGMSVQARDGAAEADLAAVAEAACAEVLRHAAQT
jgi:AcrR family transcriptional regulator